MIRSKLCTGPCGLRKTLDSFSRGQAKCRPCRSRIEVERQKRFDLRERRSLRERERYLSDPVYAERERAASRRYYWRMKVYGGADAI